MQLSLKSSKAPKKSELIILKNVDAIVGPKGQSLHHVDIGVDRGIIQWIHPQSHHSASAQETSKHARIGGIAIDGSGFVVFPGFTNAHTHAPLSFFRDLSHATLDLRSDDKASMIERYLFPAERNLDENLVYDLSFSYLIDALKSGCTQVVDHYYFARSVGKACQQLGMRAYIGETIADLGGAQPGESSYDRAIHLIENFDLNENLIQVFIAPHAADTVSPRLLEKCSHIAKHHGLMLHMHLAQSRGEYARVSSLHGISPVRYANKYGALSENSILAHVLECDEEDLRIIKHSGSSIAFCPSSQIIYQNLAPIEKFLKHEIPIVLGTDCAASCDHASMIQEMRTAYLMCKDRMGSAAPNLHHIWEWGSLNFHKLPTVQQKTKKSSIGIEVGMKADLVFLKKDLANEPVHDIAINTVMSSGSNRVEHVMIDGKWIIWKQHCTRIDEEEILRNYNKALLRIMKKKEI